MKFALSAMFAPFEVCCWTQTLARWGAKDVEHRLEVGGGAAANSKKVRRANKNS